MDEDILPVTGAPTGAEYDDDDMPGPSGLSEVRHDPTSPRHSIPIVNTIINKQDSKRRSQRATDSSKPSTSRANRPPRDRQTPFSTTSIHSQPSKPKVWTGLDYERVHAAPVTAQIPVRSTTDVLLNSHRRASSPSEAVLAQSQGPTGAGYQYMRRRNVGGVDRQQPSGGDGTRINEGGTQTRANTAAMINNRNRRALGLDTEGNARPAAERQQPGPPTPVLAATAPNNSRPAVNTDRSLVSAQTPLGQSITGHVPHQHTYIHHTAAAIRQYSISDLTETRTTTSGMTQSVSGDLSTHQSSKSSLSFPSLESSARSESQDSEPTKVEEKSIQYEVDNTSVFSKEITMPWVCTDY